jgi:hypothetical protein
MLSTSPVSPTAPQREVVAQRACRRHGGLGLDRLAGLAVVDDSVDGTVDVSDILNNLDHPNADIVRAKLGHLPNADAEPIEPAGA